jgi:hypothetical protein
VTILGATGVCAGFSAANGAIRSQQTIEFMARIFLTFYLTSMASFLAVLEDGKCALLTVPVCSSSLYAIEAGPRDAWVALLVLES